MKRILVPVDFSDHTDHACRFAMHLAGKTQAEIMLFHSFFDQLYFTDGGFSTSFESGVMLTDEIILDFFKQKEARLNEIAEKLKLEFSQETLHVPSVTTHMESGDPEVQIMHVVKQYQPDIIVMGSAGMGKKGLLSGSVARRVIDHIDIPVIAVPDAVIKPSISNIAYMTPICQDDKSAINYLFSVFNDFAIHLCCLHLTENEITEDLENKMHSLFHETIPESFENRTSYHILKHTNNPALLRSFMEDFSIDLIAFIPHKRGFIKNLFYQGLTKEDLFLTRIPIIAIKPKNND